MTKWRQAETCYYEIINVDNDYKDSDVLLFVQKTGWDFDRALEEDLNTHLALSAFFSLVKNTNQLAADEKLAKNQAQTILVEFQRMLEILGLDIPEITPEQKNKVDQMIETREKLRKEKQFEEADKIRNQLNEMNIELIDHTQKTIWMRKEKIKADS